ncbi:hypothetical protein SAMN05216337_100192 [Bradyrhizobium brasilense]|uniref:Uncharacterized protein n=1 Tax=Bradyrhizobium brasilense TaxID=1419277 RepID=A0A1G6IBB5_9BRAD|nr:hypothetical protein SAMN05216337_100192 [Bradyrhizobium brasilense]
MPRICGDDRSAGKPRPINPDPNPGGDGKARPLLLADGPAPPGPTKNPGLKPGVFDAA